MCLPMMHAAPTLWWRTGHYHYFAAFSPFQFAFPAFEKPFDTPIGVYFNPLLKLVPETRARAPVNRFIGMFGKPLTLIGGT
jgi:hypothetical protein